MTTQTLSDISTLKVGTKIQGKSGGKCIVRKELNNGFIGIEWIGIRFYSQIDINEHIKEYGWKIIESPSFDIRKELYTIQDSLLYKNGYECGECGKEEYIELDIEKLAKWIEDNKHNF